MLQYVIFINLRKFETTDIKCSTVGPDKVAHNKL